jgi:hypothetical protein
MMKYYENIARQNDTYAAFAQYNGELIGQDLKDISSRELNLIFDHSEKCLVDAYSRMKMAQQ